MLKGSPTLMLTGQKDVLLERPSVLSYHVEGPFTHLMPRCTSFPCHCTGALMLEGPSALMWTMQENVLVEDHSVLNNITKGRAILLT
jgi:hypothetical protein